MNACILKVTIGLLAVGALAARADAASPTIGSTKIPFYTGNLSVIRFMMYWGTSKGPVPPSDWASPEHIVLLKRISCFADCDYQSWALAEQEKGKWDFAVYAKNADALRAAGLKYVVFCWVHFPPKWFASSPGVSGTERSTAERSSLYGTMLSGLHIACCGAQEAAT